jgi:hypothetical protein
MNTQDGSELQNANAVKGNTASGSQPATLWTV